MNEFDKGIFLDMFIEYTKLQIKLMEDDPSMSTGTIHYHLCRLLKHLEEKKENENYISNVKGDIK